MKRTPYNFPWDECAFNGNTWKNGTILVLTSESIKNGLESQKTKIKSLIESGVLELNKEYKISDLKVYRSHSEVELEGISNITFNTVQFEFVRN